MDLCKVVPRLPETVSIRARYLAVAVILLVFSSVSANEVGVYHVSFDQDFSYATVNATIHVEGGQVSTGQGGGEAFENNWLTFVEDLTAKSADNDLLELTLGEYEAYGYSYYRWYVTSGEKPYTGPAKLDYKLNLASGLQKHPFGNEQGMQRLGTAFYSTTRPLFITSETDGARKVIFDLPDGWDLRVPWPRYDNDQNVFLVPSLDSLHNNPLVVGKFAAIDLNVLDLSFSLVLPGEIAASRAQVLDAFEAVKPAFESLFAATPGDIYNMAFFYSYAEDGEGFENGSAFTTTRKLSPETKVLWADFLVHEFMHYWNGRQIRAEERWEQQWISEGFTDYMTALILVNRRVIDRNTFVKIMEQQLGNYQFFMNSDLFAGVTIRESGKDKGRNRPGVYSGGWVMAMALDIEIQKATSQESNLTNFVRALYERFGLTGRRYTYDDIVNLANDVSGKEITQFFATYIDSRNEYPIDDAMNYFGLIGASKPYANEFYISENPGATTNQRERWEALQENRF